jgi:hypothetical protein
MSFQDFWARYPRHVGKLDAEKAYKKARTLATDEEILTGVEFYKRHKPAYADWCYPATFLRQGRWMDEPDAVVRQPEWCCQHKPPCHDRQWCETGARDMRDRMQQRAKEVAS